MAWVGRTGQSTWMPFCDWRDEIGDLLLRLRRRFRPLMAPNDLVHELNSRRFYVFLVL